MLLGVTTDTQDMSGKILSEHEVSVTEEHIIETIMSFVGGYEQIPPMYSALKVNGKKLYELARQGKEIERQPRHVDIPSIKIIDISLPRVSFSVECSKGTYIRSLCADIGDKLGCGAAMESLKRIRVGGFKIEDAITLSQVEEFYKSDNIDKYIMPSDSIFMDYMKASVKSDSVSALLNGNKLYSNQLDFSDNVATNTFDEGELIRVYDDCDNFKAVYTFIKNENCFKPFKMFL
jgi:tRNA pseudouridine55 synthase